VLAGAWGVSILCRMLHRSAPLSIYRVKSATSIRRFDCSLASAIFGAPRVGIEAVLNGRSGHRASREEAIAYDLAAV